MPVRPSVRPIGRRIILNRAAAAAVVVAANAQLKDAFVWRVMMIRHRRPPALCHTRQIDINVIILGESWPSGTGQSGRRVPRARLCVAEVSLPRANTRQSPLARSLAPAAAAAQLHHRDDQALIFVQPSLPDCVG